MLREKAVAALPREQFCPTTCDGCFKPVPGANNPLIDCILQYSVIKLVPCNIQY